jgi:predicted ATPase/DNA-binding SARP family transcriptional activator
MYLLREVPMFRLQLFGPPLIKHASDTPILFKSRKGAALLFYLALNPGQHRRAHLANLLWSEWSEEKALGNLRYTLWNVRQMLGDIPLDSDRGNITFELKNQFWVDAQAFRELLKVRETHVPGREDMARLQQAVALYQGDFLAGFEVDDAPVFEQWLHQQRTTFHEMAIDALLRLGSYHTSHHYLPEAMSATRRLLELEPWREAEHRQMMLLLALSGRRDAAINHYHYCRQLLAAELNVEPEPETTALMERIRTGQLKLAPEDSPRAAAGETPSLGGSLFGRHAEHAWLIERWARACSAQGCMALIRGEAGVGKTRLVEEVGRSVIAQGGLVLRGRCYEFSGPVPYQPIAAALKKQIAHVGAHSLPISEVWLVELAQLLPEVREHYTHLPPALPTGQSADRYRLFEAVSHFLQAITLKQPVLFFLDDLQWADADTLDMVGYLLRRLGDSRLLIVGAYRPGEVLHDHALVALQRPLHYEGTHEEMELARLSQETVKELTQSIAPVLEIDRLTLFLYQLSQGNPFILFEALNEMHERGWLQPMPDGQWLLKTELLEQEELIPDSVQTRIRRRVARLSPDSRRLLALAAVIGRPFEAKLLQAASGLELAQVLDCLDDWLSRHLMREIAGVEHEASRTGAASTRSDCRYDFSHDVLRAVVYADLSQARRQIMHTQLGDALELVYADQRDTVVEWLAHHYHHGYRPHKALIYLQQAGQQAQTVYALPLALEHYRQAMSYWERLYNTTDSTTPTEVWRKRWHLLLSQAEVSRMLGQWQSQQPTLEMVLQEVAHWGDDRDRLRVIEQQLARLEETADLDQRRRLAIEGLRLAHGLEDRLAESNFLQALADCERDMANFEQALTHYDAALINFTRLEQRRQVAFCLISIGNIHLMHDRFAQALAYFRQAHAHAKSEGYQDALIWSLNAMAHLYLFLGDLEEASLISGEALTLCELIGFDSGASTGLVIQGYIHMLNDHLEQAQEHYERAWAINQAMGQTLRMADVQSCLGYLCLLRGEAEQAVAHFKQAEVLCGNFYSGRAIEARSQRAVAHLSLKQYAEALNCSHHAVIWLSGHEHNMYAPQRVYFNQFQVLLAQGEVEEAQNALVKAYTIVRTQAEHLAHVYPPMADHGLVRERFLSNLPWNREIMTVWDRLPLATSVTVLRSLHSYPG